MKYVRANSIEERVAIIECFRGKGYRLSLNGVDTNGWQFEDVYSFESFPIVRIDEAQGYLDVCTNHYKGKSISFVEYLCPIEPRPRKFKFHLSEKCYAEFESSKNEIFIGTVVIPRAKILEFAEFLKNNP